MTNKNQTLVKDVQGALAGVALGQGLLLIGSRGMSKEKKVEMHLGGLISSVMVGGATVVANEICRRVFK